MSAGFFPLSRHNGEGTKPAHLGGRRGAGSRSCSPARELMSPGDKGSADPAAAFQREHWRGQSRLTPARLTRSKPPLIARPTVPLMTVKLGFPPALALLPLQVAVEQRQGPASRQRSDLTFLPEPSFSVHPSPCLTSLFFLREHKYHSLLTC